MATTRAQLLKMQRIILRQLKESVHRLQGGTPTELNRYNEAYKKELRTYRKISNKKELLKAVCQSDIIFGADFHPFAQSQRTHLRILRELVKHKRPVVLALEAIESKHQGTVQDYLTGKISDSLFLKKINYFMNWGFPWENYKVLFDFAKFHRLNVFGINNLKTDKASKKESLLLRDTYSASQIAKIRQAHPEAIVYVIYGDLHVAAPHLPRLTRKALGAKDSSRFLTIFQNSEILYWRLAKRKLEEKVDVVQLRRDAYCIVNSPPWLKWQAYLTFLEQTLEYREKGDESDYSEHISHFVNIIKNIWKLDQNFKDFHAYQLGDVGFVSHLSRHLKARELQWIERLLKNGKSVFIPQPPSFFLLGPDVNQMAALCGQYIHSKLRREKRLWLDFPKDFLASTWLEAVSFFASKVINSRRKFNTINDLPARHSVTLIVLEQHLRERVALQTLRPIQKIRRHRSRKPMDYYEASKILGAQLGERIYLAFLHGRVKHSDLLRWLRYRLDHPNFSKFYANVLLGLKEFSIKHHSKNERL